MGLNLKSDEAHKLAQELAGLTGESMTTAATIAMRERLERLRKERDKDKWVAEMLAIGRDCASHLKDSELLQHPDDFLYDEHGLPK